MTQRINKKLAFTIVELLVVIVVISILVAITIVSYTGITQKAVASALRSDLANAKIQLNMFQVDNSAYPTTISTDCTASPTTTTPPTNLCLKVSSSDIFSIYQVNNTTNPQSFCLAMINDNVSLRVSHNSAPSQGSCVDFSSWTINGGVSYNALTDQISLISPGHALSPLIRVDKSSSVTLTVESYATIPSPYFSTQSGVHFSSSYYEADGVTSAYNSIGYTSNGNAQAIPLSVWTKRTWQTPTGPNVVYVRFLINSSPTSYTSDNLFRNPIVTFR